MPESTEQLGFASASALRDANRALLDQLYQLEHSVAPESFLDEIERFQARAAATGAYLSTLEDRNEAQSIINFWTTVLFNNGRTPDTILVDRFDSAAALSRAGEKPPYKGLEPFQVEDSLWFYGRHKVVAAMLDKLAEGRLLAVTGLSGCGKSSVVRAGLIPRLREGAAAGSRDWLVLEPVVPGAEPRKVLQNVAAAVNPDSKALAAPSDLVAALDHAGRPVLVSIDQFEELFTLAIPDEERDFFLDSLVEAATGGEHRHVVILTMRSEYDDKVQKHPAFAGLFSAGRVQVGALTAQELRTAIEQPAAQVGVGFEPGLSEELVQRVLGEPAGLPLLQFTLLELWKRRSRDNLVNWDAYKRLGGSPREILAARADKVFKSFKIEEDRTLSRQLFLALVQIGSGLEPTSKRVLRSDLDRLRAGRDRLNRVLGIWQGSGLIRISPPPTSEKPIQPESQVEVAHEALIRNWDRLGKWIEDQFAFTRRRRVLTERASAWREQKDTLLGELSLMEADQLDDLSDEEREYVEASRVHIEQSKRNLQRQKRAALLAGVAGAALLLFGASGMTIGYQQWSRTIDAKAQLKEQQRDERARIAAERTRATQLAQQAASARLRVLQDDLAVATQQREAAIRAREEATRLHREMVASTAQAARERDRFEEERDQLAQERDVAIATAERALETARQLELGRLLPLENDRLGETPRAWEILSQHAAEIERVSRSVARLQPPPGSDIPYVGTAFLIAEGIAAIPSSMIDGEEVTDLSLDFSYQPQEDRRAAFRLESVLGKVVLSGHRISLVRVAQRNELDESLPQPAVLAEAHLGDPGQRRDRPQVQLREDMLLYSISYPMRDPRVEEATSSRANVVASRFLDPPGVKRLSPGYLTNWVQEETDLEIRHDGLMLMGSAGAPLVDLDTGHVIGINLGFYSGDGDNPVMFAVAITREFLESPALRRAVIRSAQPSAR